MMKSMANEQRKPKKYHLAWIAGVIAVILLAIGIVPRVFRYSQLQANAAAERSSLPLVDVVRPIAAATSTSLDLPGTIEPIQQASINARATGYAQKVLVDIGDKVTAGQTLAIITAPDTDQETIQGQAELVQSQAALAQAEANKQSSEGILAEDQANLQHAEAAVETARASLTQLRDQLASAIRAKGEQVANLNEAQANLDLDRVTNERNQSLAKQGFVAKQMADQTLAQYKVGVATLSSAQAAVTATDSSIEAARASVAAGIDNVAQSVDDVHSAEATVRAAQSTVQSDQAAVNEAMAGVNADNANVQRLVALQNYEKVVAPFSGIVTARNIDPGSYISGGSSSPASTSIGSTSAGASSSGASAGGSSTAGSSATTTSGSSASGGLFTIADLDRVRVYINLPQEDAALLTDGTPTSITLPSVPGRTFQGVVVHSTVALDPVSRTLVAEIQLNNTNNLLRPGMFTTVQLKIPQASGILLVPDSALVTGTDGTQLTLVGPGNKLHFQNVEVGDDDGKNIEVLSGLQLTDRIVSSPANGFREGEKVQVQKPSGKKGGHKHAAA
jgi:multidrug efflux pump subunit AcrA (membrane-fusion protein)